MEQPKWRVCFRDVALTLALQRAVGGWAGFAECGSAPWARAAIEGIRAPGTQGRLWFAHLTPMPWALRRLALQTRAWAQERMAR